MARPAVAKRSATGGAPFENGEEDSLEIQRRVANTGRIEFDGRKGRENLPDDDAIRRRRRCACKCDHHTVPRPANSII